MDCLADTGANNILMIVLAVGLVSMALLGLYLAKKDKRNLKYLAALLLLVSGVIATSMRPIHVYATSSPQTCQAAPNNSNAGGNTNAPNSSPTVQKVWNIPFNNVSEWNQFTHYNVSNDGGAPGAVTYGLTASGGTGTITANNPTNLGSHRDFYIFNPAGEVKDAEVRALVRVDFVDQVGLIMRASNLGDANHQVGVVGWTNVLFAGTGTSVAGVWSGNGEAGGVFGLDDGGSVIVSTPIVSVTADGTTGTVVFAHDLDPTNFAYGALVGNLVALKDVDSSLSNTNFTITSMPNAHTLTFNTSASGSWTTGQAAFPLNTRRWLAARVIGNQLTIKHWLPSWPEPAWNDPYNALTYTLPATLKKGDPAPTQGKFGLIVAHAKDGQSVAFSNLSFKSLDL